MTRTIAIAAAVLALSSAAAVVVLLRSSRESRPDGCSSQDSAILLQSAGRHARLQPRWSGCFARYPHAPAHPALATPVQLRGAVATFELAAQHRQRRATQDFGAALALAGDTVRAISMLSVSAAEHADPDVLSDLAAAYLVANNERHDVQDAVLALDHATHAISLAPGHRAALYNQALALTALGLDDEGDAAWRRYLEVDRESSWSVDIRGFLADPHRRAESAATQFTALTASARVDDRGLIEACLATAQVCRQHVEDELLPRWARAFASGDQTTAAATFARARLLAEALRGRGDVLDAEAVDDLGRAATRRELRLPDLAAGLDAYGRARAAFENDQRSVPLFAEAEKRLTAAASPLAGWARANHVYADFNSYDGKYRERLGPTLGGWAAEADSRGYSALAGRLMYLEALTHANRADYGPAEALCARSIEALEAAREFDHLAATETLVADSRMRVGDVEAGWSAFGKAFEAMPEIPSPRRRYAVLLLAGIWMGENRLPYASIEVLSAARRMAGASNQLQRVAESSLYRAKAYARIGDLAAARADLDTARPNAARNTSWDRGVRARNEYDAGVAEVEGQATPGLAVDAASRAMGYFEGQEYGQRVAPLHLMRGRAHAAAGDRESADRDFSDGIDTYLRYRSTMPTERQRILSQDVVWDLYEERLQLATSRSPSDVLDIAEQGRARSLVESAGAPAGALRLASLQSMLSASVRVVYYALLPRQLLVWVIARDGVTYRIVAVDREPLEQQVRLLDESIARGAPARDWQFASEQLFDLLIGSVRDVIPPGASLIVVPDGALHRLPFAALIDRSSGRYLLETHPVTTVPSATLLVQLLAQPSPLGRPRSLLAVTDPAARALPALAGADREGQSIAKLYEHTLLLSRERATKAAFVAAAPDADVVHFAGHAVASSDRPLMTHLEFASTAGAAGLDASDIAAMHLRRTRLVVLAACATAGGTIRRGEGVLSLARPFLIAGAPAVVAALWDIDDEASALFLSRFHAEYVESGDATLALRNAQLSAIATMPPAAWAAFVLVGRPGPSSLLQESDR